MRKNRVLLAHRDPAVQELATRALTHVGVTVDVTPDPDHAKRVVADGYSVIVAEQEHALLDVIAAAYGDAKPVVIVTAPVGTAEPLDASIVSLVIPEPYDAHTLVGVILACVTPTPPAVLPFSDHSGRAVE
jgi:DNA-binding IclR family transcriptional regulator